MAIGRRRAWGGCSTTWTSSGLADNTIVVYTSDQGFYLGEHGWFDKRFMYEQSLRTPLVVRWPGVVQPGRVEERIVSNVDFAATFLEAAGRPVPDDMQGRSFVPLLRGEAPGDWRTIVLLPLLRRRRRGSSRATRTKASPPAGPS